MKQQKKPARKRIESPFAKNLKDILAERGISQRAAAELAGVPVSVLNDWIAGAVPADYQSVLRLSTALACDFQWLLTDQRSQATAKDIPLSEVFDIEDEPMLSGYFQIQARRLKRKGDKDE